MKRDMKIPRVRFDDSVLERYGIGDVKFKNFADSFIGTFEYLDTMIF